MRMMSLQIGFGLFMDGLSNLPSTINLAFWIKKDVRDIMLLCLNHNDQGKMEFSCATTLLEVAHLILKILRFSKNFPPRQLIWFAAKFTINSIVFNLLLERRLLS